MKVTIGIDNGASGSVGILGADGGAFFEPMPSKPSLEGKSGKVIQRVDHQQLLALLTARATGDVRAYVERPFTGKFLNAVLPGQRSFEAVLIVLETLGIGYEVVDSRGWQRAILGDVKGSSELKRASRLRGAQRYPAFATVIKDHGDADGLLIAEHYHSLR